MRGEQPVCGGCGYPLKTSEHAPDCPTTKESSDLKSEVRAFIEAEGSIELSDERKAELTDKLTTVTDFMNESGVLFYLAGGSGLDLLDGEWSRDHQDVDTAIFSSDKKKFFDAAIAAGYAVTDPDRNVLNLNAILSDEAHNAFLYRSDDDGTNEFEVIFMPGNERDVTLSPSINVDVETFKEMAPTVTIDGREISLQPPEVILFYKLNDGRRKDYHDISNIWSSLEQGQRDTLQGWIEQGDISFFIGDTETNNIDELMRLALEADTQKESEFYANDLDGIEQEITEGFMANAEEIYSIRESTPLKDDFFQNVAQKYNGFVPERRAMLIAISDVLYGEDTVDLEAFKTWALKKLDLQDRIKPIAAYKFKDQKLWEVKQ